MSKASASGGAGVGAGNGRDSRASLAPGSPELEGGLKAAYDHLRLFDEFAGGPVELPRLYHEAKQRMPGLTVDKFHAGLEHMAKNWKVELHGINEEHTAKEKGLGIRKGGKLLYYVVWRK